MYGQSIFGSLFGGSGFKTLTDTQKVETVQNRLTQYTPTFIKTTSPNYIAVSFAVSKMFVSIYNALWNLRNETWTGKGLRLTADAKGILYKKSDTDTVIQNKLSTLYDVLQKRGTEQGIIDDLNSLDGTVNCQVEYFEGENTSWILDESYPETNVNKTNFLDTQKAIKVSLGLSATIGTARISQNRIGEHISQHIKPIDAVVSKKIIPIDLPIIYK